ncbi:unnamed protein product [Caenorhabditis auriculariae]|uniref:Uncharacterized protein n=1 Tax=Caenorhabditis auriculariae TaxID=2777116 RepID=A0A8S1HP55_9PELO|nr:unnamed protein product [Caenorhabditis auriculariae]
MILSRDSVTVTVDAVVYYCITDATTAVVAVENAENSTKLLAQTTLRTILGTHTLTQILSERESISHHMQVALDEATESWGVKVERVELKDVRLPSSMQRAMAAEAEASREAGAKLIAAKGEFVASQALSDAASVINSAPGAMQLRYLQTLQTISAEKNTTVIFPFPIELFSGFLNKLTGAAPSSSNTQLNEILNHRLSAGSNGSREAEKAVGSRPTLRLLRCRSAGVTRHPLPEMKPKLLLSLLLFQAVSSELYPNGPGAGDKILDYTVDQNAIVLESPLIFMGTSVDEIFLSHNGIIGLDLKLPEKIEPLQKIRHPAIAVYYAPASDGNIFYRITSDPALLSKLTRDVQNVFFDATTFSAKSAAIITWKDIRNAEKDEPASFQLAIVWDAQTTFTVMYFEELPWSSSMGYYAQSGFVHSEGQFMANVNSGGPDVSELGELSNNPYGNSFIFRVSSPSIEHPREEDEEYDYKNYENNAEYDSDEKKNQGENTAKDCPKDVYANNCPKECSVLVDRRGCSKCICAETPVGENELGNGDESRKNAAAEAPDASQRLVEPDSQLKPVAGAGSCAQRTEGECHANSICQDFDVGYCCVCDTGYYGNGRECLAKGEPQRISGSFEGVINGIPIDRTDLHTFVTATDGNVYTAISKIPSDLGHPMLLLQAVGSIMGWLFAEVQSPTAYNGFQLTGGLFNRSVTLHIGNGHSVSIKQEFSGRDIYHYFKSHVYVSGTVPDVAPGSEIVFPDYEEEYRRDRPGHVSAYTGMDVEVKDGSSSEKIRITIDQQINFAECPHRTFDRDAIVSLQVKRVHVTYDSTEGIVRFGAKNYVARKGAAAVQPAVPAAPLSHPNFDRRQHGQPQQTSDQPIEIPSDDACAPGRHSCTLPHMKCRVVDPSYRCECHPGFQASHDASSPIGWKCVDLDECTRGDHNCDQHARCSNNEGSFTCQCLPGYSGDGRTCLREQRGHAPQPAQAVQMENGAGADGSCTNHRQCHQWGECVFTSENPTGKCRCRGWYTGDGVEHCGPPNEKPKQNVNIPKRGGKPCGSSVCDLNAECMPDPSGGSECVCRAGFSGNGLTCEALLEETPRNPEPQAALGKVCRSHEECSEHGSCAYHPHLGYYQCSCREPYVGNGVDCTLPGAAPIPGAEAVGCDVTNDCSEFADCVYERTDAGVNFKCVCKAGYTGDGKYCMQSQLAIVGLAPPPQPPLGQQPGCDQLRNCGTNAQCVFDDHNRRYKCECHQGFTGDGQTCVALASPSSAGAEQPPKKACRDQSECHANAHCVIDEFGAGEYVCECLPGFSGDGDTSCVISDQCNPSDPSSCRQNAKCTFSDVHNAFACQCVEGFKGNGHDCVPFAPATTCRESPRICHANAQCVFHQESNSHICLCKPGSVGDGYKACDVVEVPRCSNCSANAHCAQSLTSGGFSCKCNAGFHGNGQLCVAMTSCLDDKSQCDSHADCVPGEGGHYVCNCHYGYHGDGRTCSPESSESRSETLLVARGMAIFERSTKPEVFGKQLIVIPHHIPVGIDFDCKDKKIVWSDISGHSIRTASLNGTDHKSFLTQELSSPEGIAVDWSARNVYYADSLNDEIGVASLDGKYKKALITEGLVNPRSLAIDLNAKHLYYSDWHRENPYIGRVDLDGRNNRVFLNEDVHLPNGLTILPNRRELCWVDAGSHKLSCIGFNGGGRRVVFASLQYPFGLTHDNEARFYWTDWKDNRVHSVGVYGEGYGSFQISLGGSGKVFGILSLPKHCVGAANECGTDNGGCKYLCLPSQQGVRCECPDNVSGC